MISYWEVLRRCEEGPLMKEAEFDKLVMKTCKQLVRKYDLKFDPEHIIPNDEDLIDRAWQAAIDFTEITGVYVLDTGRIVQLSHEEIESCFYAGPYQIPYGAYKDLRYAEYRTRQDNKMPHIQCAPVGNPCSEEIFEKYVRSYCREELFSSICGPLVTSFNGMRVKSDSPLEVEGSIWNSKVMRNALEMEGRPNLAIANWASTGERADAVLAAGFPQFGARPGDASALGAIAEMKVDYERMKRGAVLRQLGHTVHSLLGPIMGGYPGGPEGTLIVTIAHFFLASIVYRAQMHEYFPFHINYTCNTMPEMLWLISVSAQAVSKNSNILVLPFAMGQAGPCTEMCFNEFAAFSLVSTVSGASSIGLGAQSRNKHDELWTGYAPLFGARVAKVASQTGITLDEANEMVKKITAKYNRFHAEGAPMGKKFSECYDLFTLEPTEEHQKIYTRCRDELKVMGMDFSVIGE